MASTSCHGGHFIHDTLELHGWQVEIPRRLLVNGLAPLRCKTDRGHGPEGPQDEASPGHPRPASAATPIEPPTCGRPPERGWGHHDEG